MLNHIFTTPVWRERTALTASDLVEIRDYLAGLRTQTAGEQKSNRGGWHSRGNLFGVEHRPLPVVREAITAALFAYLREACAFSGEIRLALTGWAIINRPGDYNAPHNHAANMLSGALYIAVPSEMRGGAIVFQDPRLNLNAHETEAMQRAAVKPPWLSMSVNVSPAPGEILVFPSWLVHWVEPFQSDDPAALRMVVSFNATVR